MSITVNLHNWDVADLEVVVTDLNVEPPQVIFNQLLKYGETVAITIQENFSGYGRVKWFAQRVDAPDKTAERTVEPSQYSNVDVTTHFG